MSQFYIQTQVFFSEGRYEQLLQMLKALTLKNVLFIVDSVLAEHPVVAEVAQQFEQAGYQVSQANYQAKGEPTYRELDAFAASVRDNNADLIVAFGGGSAIDLAKGVSVLLTNPGKGTDYRGMHKVQNPNIPVVAFPSTAGTGTEVTWTASFIDDEEGKKLGINGKNVAPLCGVLEPRLVASCPRPVALSAGLDTMVHAVEAVTAKTATPLTISMGSQAFAMVYEYLPIALDNPENLEAWEQVQIAAYLAGIAMMNAGGGPASGISYPLGVHYAVPHGHAGGIFLPGVFEMNVAKGYTGYQPVYRLLPEANTQAPVSEQMQDFVKIFNAFYDRVGGYRGLSQWQCVGQSAIEKLTALTLEQRAENLHLNPVPFEQQDVEQLLESVCV